MLGTNPGPQSLQRSQYAAVPDRVVIINDSSVVRGGATGIAMLSAQMLAGRGVPVTVVTGDDGRGLSASGQGIDVMALDARHILEGSRAGSMVQGIYNRQAEQFMSRWIARHDTPGTVYHLHGWSKILSPSVFRALRTVKRRLVVHAHDFFLVCPNGGYFDFQREMPCARKPMSISCMACNCDRRHYAHKVWRTARQGARRALSAVTDTSTVLAVHDGMMEHLERGGLDRRKLKALRNPVSPWRAQRVPAEKNRCFVFVGRLESDKGIELLARAARRARVQLRIVGTGVLSQKLADEYPEAQQVGWKSRAEIADIVADARALVMPSRYREPFGIVALEAAGSGIPVILSEYAMLAKEFVENGYGVACDPHDEAALAGTLSKLAGDDALIAKLSQNAFAGARSLAPTADEWINELLSIYASTLDAERLITATRTRAAAVRPVVQPATAHANQLCD